MPAVGLCTIGNQFAGANVCLSKIRDWKYCFGVFPGLCKVLDCTGIGLIVGIDVECACIISPALLVPNVALP